MLRFGILTISDKGSRGQRRDESGMTIRDRLSLSDSDVVKYEIVPDEMDIITSKLAECYSRSNSCRSGQGCARPG